VELEFKVEERTRGLQDALHQVEISQAEMKQLLERERELSEIKSRFVSLASHEFRTPLTTILTSATLASSYSKQDQVELRKKHLNRIEESVVFLNGLLHDFLSLGKIEEGKVDIKADRFDLKEFFSEIIYEMNVLLKPAQQINYTHTGTPITYTDSNLLKHVVVNLISNAIKFSPENSTIDIISEIENETASLKIIDQGMGIPKSDQVHLFERFFRASNVTNIQGTGLGLHIVGRYVDLLNGTIHYSSELEKGSTFIIKFPCKNLNDFD
jgi:signal transduction histidine kinase